MKTKQVATRSRVDKRDSPERPADADESHVVEEHSEVVKETYSENRAASHADEDVVAADEETVVYEPSTWDVARGWVRTLTIWVGLALLVVESVLAFRLAFLLGNANPGNGFVDFIYDVSGPLTEPFEGIASESSVGSGVFDPATLIAMIVYAVAAFLFAVLIWAVTAGPSPVGGRQITSRAHSRGTAETHH